MKKSLDHLPEHKQKEIFNILKIIKEEANPEKVILFGSHATGEWVEDEYVEKGATYTYISDYDLLVVIKNGGTVKEHEIASRIENRTEEYENDVSPIVHDIDYVNKGLGEGQYFFRDIVSEGILLYDTEKYQFTKPKQLTPNQELKNCKGYYKKWIKSASRFLKYTKTSFREALEVGDPLNEVVFLLHQTAERFYGGILLIFTGYKPKTHKLKVYRKYSKHISDELNRIFRFPLDDAEEYRLFDIFQKSYLDSRYADDYLISKEDLEALIGKVEKLSRVTQRLCKERIDTLKKN